MNPQVCLPSASNSTNSNAAVLSLGNTQLITCSAAHSLDHLINSDAMHQANGHSNGHSNTGHQAAKRELGYSPNLDASIQAVIAVQSHDKLNLSSDLATRFITPEALQCSVFHELPAKLNGWTMDDIYPPQHHTQPCVSEQSAFFESLNAQLSDCNDSAAAPPADVVAVATAEADINVAEAMALDEAQDREVAEAALNEAERVRPDVDDINGFDNCIVIRRVS